MKADLCRMELDHSMDEIRAYVHELFWKICASNEPLDIEEMHGKLANIIIVAENMQRHANQYIDSQEERQ